MIRLRRRRAAPDRSAGALAARASRRLGLQVGLCMAVIVVLLCGIAVLIVLHDQKTSTATRLTQATAHTDDVTDPPAGGWLVIAGPNGTTATPGLPAGLPDTTALARTARTGRPSTVDFHTGDDHEYRIRTVPRGGTTVQVILDLSANHRQRARLAVAMLASGGLGLVLAAAAGVWFARRALRPLAVALALQRRFVADASHELRTPLTLLSTRAQLLRRHLRRGTDPDQLAAETDAVVADAAHLTDILEDLLLAADTGAEPPVESIDLVALAGEVADAARAVAAEHSITLTTTGDTEPVPVAGTPGGLRRALTALLDNAIRHARNHVSIAVHRDGTRVEVKVSDDGPGIAADMLPHVFERFASTGRHPPQPPPRGRRYGLGLALVAEVANRHGGAITADTPRAGGATLRLTLPVLAPSPRRRPPREDPPGDL